MKQLSFARNYNYIPYLLMYNYNYETIVIYTKLQFYPRQFNVQLPNISLY